MRTSTSNFLIRGIEFTVPALAGAALLSACACSSTKSHAARQEPAPIVYTGGAEQPGQGAAPSMSGQEQVSATGGQNTNMVIPLAQESVVVGKREVDAGTVTVKKTVKTETVNQPVELRHEEVSIERGPGGGQASAQAQPPNQPFQEQQFTIQLKREEPVVQKEVTSAGQVTVQTHSIPQQTNLTAEVRREDVEVAKAGNPQDVTVGQNIQSSQGNEGMGAPGAPSGQSSGSSMGGPADITDAAGLGADPATLAGRSVQLSGLKVDEVIGDRVVVLTSDSGQKFYALSPQSSANLHPGDMVTVRGTIKQPTSTSLSTLGLQGQATDALSSQTFYIDAQRIEPSAK